MCTRICTHLIVLTVTAARVVPHISRTSEGIRHVALVGGVDTRAFESLLAVHGLFHVVLRRYALVARDVSVCGVWGSEKGGEVRES
jgi:hypothetical protein